MIKCCNRKTFAAICFALLVIAGVSTLALYVVIYYSGSSMQVSAGDVTLLSDHISNFWCRADTLTIDSKAGGLSFNASIVPKLSTKTVAQSFDVAPALQSGHGRAVWRLKLAAGSRIDVKECANVSGVLSLIMRGKTVNEDCVKNREFHSYDSSEEGIQLKDDPCKSIVYRRYLVGMCHKGGTLLSAAIPFDDDYLVVFDSVLSEPSLVKATLMFTRQVYDLSDSIYNCTSHGPCTLPLRFGSSDAIVAQMDLNSQGDSATLSWSCVRRHVAYGVVFSIVPLATFIIVIVGVCLCKRRYQKRAQNPEFSNVAARTEDANERTPLLTDRRPDADPLLEKIGPIPGPYQYHPTAPPNPSQTSGVLDGLPDPPTRPPSYEEAVRNDRQRVAS